MDKILANILQFTETGKGSTVPTKEVHSNKATTAYERTKTNPSRLSIIIFSKERPYQLHQLLRSIERYFIVAPTKVIVLFISGKYKDEYDQVFKLHKEVVAKEERNFSLDLQDIINQYCQNLSVSHLMFCVDDLIFINLFDYRDVLSVLTTDESCFTVHCKLHPGIRFSHASGKTCFPPPLNCITSPSKSKRLYKIDALKWELAVGKSDWRYPFDLCGSIYRTEDVRLLLSYQSNHPSNEEVSRELTFTNPNNLEVFGNAVFWKENSLWKRYDSVLCLPQPVLTVVTVNQVQTTYEVPIYNHSNDFSIGSVDYMNLNLLRIVPGKRAESEEEFIVDESLNYDLARYANKDYVSVHIGDLFFQRLQQELISVERPIATAKVTVIIPVHNGEKYIESCLNSLFYNDQGCLFNVIVVNDGSDDQTCPILASYQSKLAEEMRAELIILNSDHQGLPVALDLAISHSDTEFVARLDIDDCCLEGRLKRQFSYLIDNPQIVVLGGQAHRISEDSPDCGNSCIAMQTHPILVQFASFFHCPVLHPSVMFRKSAIVECGGYRNEGGTEKDYRDVIEDYYLWSRVLEKFPCSIANIPSVVIQLRMHKASKSKREFQAASLAARRLQLKMWSDLIGSKFELTERLLSVLLKPESEIVLLEEKEVITAVVSLLEHMKEAFIDRYTSHFKGCGWSPSSLAPSSENEDFIVVDETRRIVLSCLDELHQRYVFQLLSHAINKFPDYLIPEKYQEDFQLIQSNQLKSTILSNLSKFLH